jgi:4-hydroxybenzoate polyprenyltransferase
VWSNCLAGWWLGGAGTPYRLPWLLLGATSLYTGGMFLNDAFDTEFDRLHRPERPIPAGAISLKAVWLWSALWLLTGLLCLLALGTQTGVLGILLLLCILIYDTIHKKTSLAPIIMGVCRLLLYLVAASAAQNGVTSIALWSGLALAAYIVGLSYLARRESFPAALQYWPILLLAAPVPVALIVNEEKYREPALLLAAVFGLWVIRSLRPALSSERNIGRTVANLLAGIVFVDWLAVAYAPRELSFLFPLLFLSALLFQRVAPAT